MYMSPPFYQLRTLAKKGFVCQVRADHYSLLATVEDALGVARLGSAAGKAAMADLFAAQ